MNLDVLDNIPRLPLAQLPTPIVRVSLDEFGIRLLVKRDDLTGNGLSGNKVRKLEYLLADARRAGADTLLSCGAVQSNCARALAVAAAMTGFRCHLMLTGSAPDELDGNLLVCRLAGAEVEFLATDNTAERDAALTERAQQLRSRGRRPYLVPFGGSSVVGTFGYVHAGLEIAAQLGERATSVRHVVTPLASGGTYAGLFLGFALAGVPIRPVGAFIQGTTTEWVPVLLDLIHATARRLGIVVDAQEHDIRLIDARGSGYGVPTAGELRFIAWFCRSTGLLLDPVYTGKAMFALMRYLDCGAFDREREIVFLHSGGTFGLFPHRSALADVLGDESDQIESHTSVAHLPGVAARAQPRMPAHSPATPLRSSQTISIASP